MCSVSAASAIHHRGAAGASTTTAAASGSAVRHRDSRWGRRTQWALHTPQRAVATVSSADSAPLSSGAANTG